jgi:hypothetical protein
MYASLPGMPRRLSILLIAVAALLAVEPLLHQHPITGRSTDAAATSSATCVVCAAGVSRLADAAPAVVAPVRIVYASFATVTTSLRIGVALTLPSRAPPAA